MFLLTTEELIRLSVIPKAEILLKAHFAERRLLAIVDRIKGEDDRPF